MDPNTGRIASLNPPSKIEFHDLGISSHKPPYKLLQAPYTPKMAPSATLYISVGDYLKFEVAHNYTAGRDNCHWSLRQYNGPAEPMPMHLYGGTEVGEAVRSHILQEMKHYVPSNPGAPQNVVMRLQNGVNLCYEGLLILPSSNDGTILNIYAIQDRFKAIFDLFSYMIRESPF